MEAGDIQEYYSNEIEKDRLELDIFKLEGVRTKEIITRYLPKEKIKILDIGGGAGYYAFWLQEKGHEVTLIDLSPKNIELVKDRSERRGLQLSYFEEGDATALKLKDGQFDLVLMLGPLYHLTDRNNRVKALSEAKRVLKPGGILLSAIISRYASLFDGFKRDLVSDSDFENILKKDLESGIHLNKTGNPEYFTTSYFHAPAEITGEIKEAGLKPDKLIAVESFGWMIDDIKLKLNDKAYMEKLFYFINQVESNEDLLAMSPHIIAVSKKEV